MSPLEGRIDLPQRFERNPFSDQRKIEAREAVGRLRMYFDRLRDGESSDEQGREIRKILIIFHPDKPGNAEYKDLANIASRLFEANKNPLDWSRQLMWLGKELKTIEGVLGVTGQMTDEITAEKQPYKGESVYVWRADNRNKKEKLIEWINLDWDDEHHPYEGKKIFMVDVQLDKELLKNIPKAVSFFEIEGEGVFVVQETYESKYRRTEGFFGKIKNLKLGKDYVRTKDLGEIKKITSSFEDGEFPYTHDECVIILTDRVTISVGSMEEEGKKIRHYSYISEKK